MKRVLTWLRARFSRLIRRKPKYAGPPPPGRHEQVVNAFAYFNPRATQEEWISFAVQLADESYKSGYTRAVERSLKDSDSPFAAIEDERDHDWSWVDLAPGEKQLQEIVDKNSDVMERLSPEDRMFYQDRIGREMGGYRVVLVPSKDPKRR